jgi:histidyl-tRNA synthetase
LAVPEARNPPQISDWETDTMVKKEKLSFQLKTPKGTQDWSGADLRLRNAIFTTIRTVFETFGGETLDTPVFELQDVLKGKYGEDSKLIYDLQDQGGELTSLRYDLTVPFARYLAMNSDVKHMKRYAIDKVYRRDQPAMGKGRKREFYQCDFDIASATSDPVYCDAEIVTLISKVFHKLGWDGSYTIKINNRKILDGIFQVCGVPEEKLRSISSAVDKLDKALWSEVRHEMVEEKGLDGAVADQIQKFVTLKEAGGRSLLKTLQVDERLMANDSAKAGIDDMAQLMGLLDTVGVLEHLSFDLSLARGLDYYTGVIYEVVTEGSAPAAASAPNGDAPRTAKKPKKPTVDDDDRTDDPTLGVGSVAAGGRYDNLVERFLPKAVMPCVGISFGVDRIFSITKARMAAAGQLGAVRASRTDVLVMAFGGKGFDGMAGERMRIATLLRDAGVSTEYMLKEKVKLPQQFKEAERVGARIGVILGEDEMGRGECKVKEMGLPEEHPEKNGVDVKLGEVVVYIKGKLGMQSDPGMSELDVILKGTEKLTVAES